LGVDGRVSSAIAEAEIIGVVRVGAEVRMAAESISVIKVGAEGGIVTAEEIGRAGLIVRVFGRFKVRVRSSGKS
jgi:Lon protease-like protein